MAEARALGSVSSPTGQALVAVVRDLAPRLRAYVRREVRNLDDAEDIVQDALTELAGAADLMQPVEHVAGWLFRVARNRIIDRFRRRQRRGVELHEVASHDGNADPERILDDLLPRNDDGPEAAYARELLLEELAAAIDELPPAQREIFVQHEIEGLSFRELARGSGTPINTLLGRKHAAVRRLRRRLALVHAEFSE